MAAALCTALTVLLSVFVHVNSLKGGKQVSQCEYPGVVALLLPGNNAIFCGGVRINGVLYVPELCGSAIEEITQFSDILLVYGDGTKNLTIPMNSTGTLSNGVYQLTIPEPMVTDCNPEATLYSAPTTVDSSTCEIAGYGGDESSGKIYDGILNVAPMTRSTSTPCCKLIFNSLNSTEKGVILDQEVPLNCVSSPGSSCGVGDLGGPVYCKNAGGERVVVGLAASTPCESGSSFLLHDLTGGASDFKFGIQS